MAVLKGDEGSMTYGGSAVAELRAWRMTGIEQATIDVSAKGDTIRTYQAGRVDPGMVSAEVYLDGAATGAGPWIASVLAGTGTEVTMVCLADTGKSYTFSAIPTGFEAESPEGDSTTNATLSAKINGTITEAWT